MKRVLPAAALLLVPVLQAAPPARPPVDKVLETLSRVEEFRQVAISPDGSRVAWVESVRRPDGLAVRRSAVWLAELSSLDRPPLRLTAAPAAEVDEHDVAWSPDGKRLAFLSDGGTPGQLQLHVVDLETGRVKRLTDATGQLASPLFTPDGKGIAFLFIQDLKEAAGPLAPAPRDSGVVEETVFAQRIALLDAEGGALKLVSPPDLFVYEFDVAPDGKGFAGVAAHGSGDASWWVAELWWFRADGREVRSLLKPPYQIANPRVSPDGKSVAVIGGLMSDAGLTGGDIIVVPFDGRDARNLTPGLKSSPSWLAWRSANEILFSELADGASAIASLDIPSGRISTLWSAPESISPEWVPGLSVARDGTTSAVVRHSFRTPPEVQAGPIGSWKPITRRNAGISPFWGEAKSLHVNSDGLNVQGWLLPPATVESGKKYPMVVLVHGGPTWAHRPGWPGAAVGVLASQGYFVFLPNPRGSLGQGLAFQRANVKDLGFGDFRDILRGVDTAVASAPVDTSRVGLFGWSYGGYMTMWAVTQTTRFRAAVAGAGIADWQSYYGQNRIDQWMIPFFGASVYDDPHIYARSSPLTYVKSAKTPTLILQGERDAEVPAAQAYQFWRALKALGVPTQLVIYPDEGHVFGKPAHQVDLARRLVGWFDRWLR